MPRRTSCVWLCVACAMLGLLVCHRMSGAADVPAGLLEAALQDLDVMAESTATRVPAFASKLRDGGSILQAYEQGQERVKVIVNLREAPEVEAARSQWAGAAGRQSLQVLQQRVQLSQTNVLSSLRPGAFALRHRFANQAGFSAEVTMEGLVALLVDPRVATIEPVRVEKLQTRQGIPLMAGSKYRSTYNGEGVAIAIVDSGIDYMHPKLGHGPIIDGNEVVGNGKVIGGYDAGNQDIDPIPETHSCVNTIGGVDIPFDANDHSHGTCCAGIAAGDPNGDGENTGDYIGGVAPGARLYALKVIDSNCLVNNDAVIAAWDWCVSHQYDDPNYPILAISYSLGSGLGYHEECDCAAATEGFERGDFLGRPWLHTGDPSWKISSTGANSGTFCAQAGLMGFYENCQLATVVDCKEGYVSFWEKTRTIYDVAGIVFYIDGKMIDLWSGYTGWSRWSYKVAAGPHVFTWAFLNLDLWSSADSGWIDDIEFPVRDSNCPSAYAMAANNATAAGITVLAASGNEGNCNGIAEPACFSNVVSVGAVYDANGGMFIGQVGPQACESILGLCIDDTTQADAVPCWSNTGPTLDLLAPSNNASTTDIGGTNGYSTDDYSASFGGTSASCPYAAGAVACLQSAAKVAKGRFLTPQEVREILTSTGDNITDPKAGIAIPRVNLERAIEKLFEPDGNGTPGGS